MATMLLAANAGLRGALPSSPAVSIQRMAERCAAGVPL
jgi:hypothetical protein